MSRDGFTGAYVWLALGADQMPDRDRTKGPARLRSHIGDSHKTYYGIFYIGPIMTRLNAARLGSIKVYLSERTVLVMAL